MASGVVGIFILTSYLLTLGTVTLQNYLQTDTALAYGEYSPLEYKADITKEPTMKEWVLNYVEEQGLDRWEADRIIDCESGWNDYAYGINTNGSTDFGILQVNSIHKKTISVECRFDYKCATKWAVNKVKADGGWSAWVCANKLGIK